MRLAVRHKILRILSQSECRSYCSYCIVFIFLYTTICNLHVVPENRNISPELGALQHGYHVYRVYRRVSLRARQTNPSVCSSRIQAWTNIHIHTYPDTCCRDVVVNPGFLTRNCCEVVESLLPWLQSCIHTHTDTTPYRATQHTNARRHRRCRRVYLRNH